MSKLHNFLTRFQLQYRPAPTLELVAMGAAIILSAATLVSIGHNYAETTQHLSELQVEVAILEEVNEELRYSIDGLGTADSIREIARTELGMVESDAIIIDAD